MKIVVPKIEFVKLDKKFAACLLSCQGGRESIPGLGCFSQEGLVQGL